jgi:hypothetical protein
MWRAQLVPQAASTASDNAPSTPTQSPPRFTDKESQPLSVRLANCIAAAARHLTCTALVHKQRCHRARCVPFSSQQSHLPAGLPGRMVQQAYHGNRKHSATNSCMHVGSPPRTTHCKAITGQTAGSPRYLLACLLLPVSWLAGLRTECTRNC